MPTQALTPVRGQEPPCETFTTFNFTICVQRHNLFGFNKSTSMPAHVCYKSKKGTHLFQYQIKLIRDSESVQTNCVGSDILFLITQKRTQKEVNLL